MLRAKEYRKIARESLRGHWLTAIGTSLVAGFLGASIHIGSDFGSSMTAGGGGGDYEETEQMVQEILYSDWFQKMLPILAGVGLVILIWGLICLIVGGAVTLGYARFNLQLVDGGDVRFRNLFSHMNRKWEGFCMQFFRGMLILLWSLLLVIPGIIASYRYAMTAYILAENEELSVMEAISLSKKMMKGNKWKLFCLELSFIGWTLLCILTLGIASLWVNPYIEAAKAAFYREVSEQKFSRPNVETQWSEDAIEY
jgi:hypothetical protein